MIGKILNCFYFLVYIMLFISMFVVFYWYNYPYKPLIFKDKVFPVVTKTVKRGGTLNYISNYCKSTSITAIVSRTFINDIIYSTPSIVSGRDMGCHKIIVQVIVPLELPAGKYFIHNSYAYHMNPFRTVVITQDTEKFEVIE
jgi:hypothetical protein